jgi:hypothetical protein
MLGRVYFVIKIWVLLKDIRGSTSPCFRRYALLHELYKREMEFDPHQTASSVFDIVTGAQREPQSDHIKLCPRSH